MKIPIHSFVDIITNSSTVIFTYQDGCLEPAKEVLREILKIEGVDGDVDDLFYFGVFMDEDRYTDYIWENEKENEELSQYKEIDISKLIISIIKGEVEKPKWFDTVGEDYDVCPYESNLYIIAKDEKYKSICEKLLKFLNAIDSEGYRDG